MVVWRCPVSSLEVIGPRTWGINPASTHNPPLNPLPLMVATALHSESQLVLASHLYQPSFGGMRSQKKPYLPSLPL